MKPLLCDKVGSLLTFLVRIGEMGLILSIRILFAISDSGISVEDLELFYENENSTFKVLFEIEDSVEELVGREDPNT